MAKIAGNLSEAGTCGRRPRTIQSLRNVKRVVLEFASDLCLSPNNPAERLRLHGGESGRIQVRLIPEPVAIFGANIVDELEIFDRALSEGEIQAIFNAGSGGKSKD